MLRLDGERTPGFKLFLTIVVGLVLTIPLFSVWLLVYDRQTQSEEAQRSITEGWGGPQAMTGPVLVIPYRATATETVVENGQRPAPRPRPDRQSQRGRQTQAPQGRWIAPLLE